MTQTNSNNTMLNPPIPSSDALRLLETFDYLTLGDGNPVAGMNTLVSMCSTIAAVAGPDAAVACKAGARMPVGLSTLTSGSLSTTLLDATVLDPLRRLQNVANVNVGRANQKIPALQLAEHQRKHIGPPKDPGGFLTPSVTLEARDQMIIADMTPGSQHCGSFAQSAALMLTRGTLSDRPEFLTRPGFLFDGMIPELLSRQLEQCHRFHPLVTFAIRDPRQLHQVAPVISTIIKGGTVAIKLPMHVKGFAVVRMPWDALKQAVREEEDTDCLGDLLWLVDIPGEEAGLQPSDHAGDGHPHLDGIRQRMEQVLASEIAARLGEGPVKPYPVCDGFQKVQNQIVRQLARLEAVMPGISGSLRNLFPTLVYGMGRLMSTSPRPEGTTWSIESLRDLAVFLSRRMAYLHQLARREEEMAARRKFAVSICRKLKDGPQSARDLTRRHDCLPIGLCRDILHELGPQKVAEIDDDVWCLTSDVEPEPPVLDVI